MAKKADVTYATIKAAIAHQFVRGEVTWEELKATSVILNYYSLNQYIDLDPFSFSDSTALSVTKTAAPESLILSDTQQLNLQKQLSETLSFSENVDVVLIVTRAFSDSSAISDVSVLTMAKNLSETLTISELLSMVLAVSKTDSTQITDTSNLSVSKSATETLSVTDSFSRVGTYSRAFTDAFSLDDLETHLNGALLHKTNVFGFSDASTFTFQKNATDSVSFSESFVHSLSRQNYAVLNASALNTYAFNSSLNS